MMRKLMLGLLTGAICLLAVTSVLAQKNAQPYDLNEYEQMVGKKLEFDQAPMLRAMVAAGELPPLEERLPQEPLVIIPSEEIGQYGGTLRTTGGDMGNFHDEFGNEFLAAYSPDMAEIFPNVLKGWEASADAKTFTLYLRKGMKWSDGVPFTADDLLFFWEDVGLNKEIYPNPPGRAVVGGEPGVLKKIDDYTVEWSFVAPLGVFIENLARWRPSPYLPKHYLKQFHPKYTPMSEIEKLMKQEGFDSWVELWGSKQGWAGTEHITPERPVISAWVAQNKISAPIQTLTRNPYYWKVDSEGNQLPYIDKVTRFALRDSEAALLKTLAGELDLTGGWAIGGMQNYSMVMQNREKGDYRVILTIWPSGVSGMVFFNFAHKDPVLKKLINDKNFRVALSVAINREEINQLVFKGLGTPSNPTAGSGPPFYGELLGKQNLQYDPELANQLLDELGLDKRDAEGYRLRSDGERLRMVIRTDAAKHMEFAEFYKGYWKEVGIEVVPRLLGPGLMWPLFTTGEFDIHLWADGFAGRPMNPLLRMGNAGIYYWQPLWQDWINSDGEKGEMPPPEVFQMIEIREKALQEPDEAKRNALTLEIFEIHDEAFWFFAGVIEPKEARYAVAQNRLRNVAGAGFLSEEYVHSISAQYFIKE